MLIAAQFPRFCCCARANCKRKLYRKWNQMESPANDPNRRHEADYGDETKKLTNNKTLFTKNLIDCNAVCLETPTV